MSRGRRLHCGNLPNSRKFCGRTKNSNNYGFRVPHKSGEVIFLFDEDTQVFSFRVEILKLSIIRRNFSQLFLKHHQSSADSKVEKKSMVLVRTFAIFIRVAVVNISLNMKLSRNASGVDTFSFCRRK